MIYIIIWCIPSTLSFWQQQCHLVVGTNWPYITDFVVYPLSGLDREMSNKAPHHCLLSDWRGIFTKQLRHSETCLQKRRATQQPCLCYLEFRYVVEVVN